MNDYRVLSAGCSTGAELYSIAMEFARREVADSKLIGIDLNRKVIQEATQGRYDEITITAYIGSTEKWSLSRDQIRRYCRREKRDIVFVPAIRDRVSFYEGNLVTAEGFEALPEQEYGIILCRNVLKYMTKESQVAILQNLRAHLAQNGYLMIGKREHEICSPEIIGFTRVRNFTSECPTYVRGT